jgi:iron(III) transport system substrate-binding protein
MAAACAPAAAPGPSLPPGTGAQQAQIARPADKTTQAAAVESRAPTDTQDWDRLLVAARNEGQVVVAGNPTAEARQASTEAFEKRYGIKVHYEPLGGARGAELVERVRSERAGGAYLWDVFIGGVPTITRSFKPMGVLEPIEQALILPEVKDPRNWVTGLEFTDSDRTGLITALYAVDALHTNSQLAPPGQFTSYRQFLDPRWKGQIVFHDPRIQGVGESRLTFLLQHPELGEDYLRALVRQDLVVLRDARQELDLIGHGRHPVCLACATSVATPLIERGLPITTVPAKQMKEGGYLTTGGGNVALFNRAPHPSAARVYLNWLFGKEGQELQSRAVGFPSTRVDVDKSWVAEYLFPTEGFYKGYTEEAQRFREEVSQPLAYIPQFHLETHRRWAVATAPVASQVQTVESTLANQLFGN